MNTKKITTLLLIGMVLIMGLYYAFASVTVPKLDKNKVESTYPRQFRNPVCAGGVERTSIQLDAKTIKDSYEFKPEKCGAPMDMSVSPQDNWILATEGK